MDTLEIKIDELSKWKQALEVDLKELSKELDKVQEKIIRQAIRFEIFKGNLSIVRKGHLLCPL